MESNFGIPLSLYFSIPKNLSRQRKLLLVLLQHSFPISNKIRREIGYKNNWRTDFKFFSGSVYFHFKSVYAANSYHGLKFGLI